MTPLEKLPELTRLKLKSQSFPDALYEARRALAEAKKAVKDVENQQAQIEAETLLDVQAATEGNPAFEHLTPGNYEALKGEVRQARKSLFTNEASRKAEIRRRLAVHPTYRQLGQRLEQAESGVLSAELALRKIEDEHRSYRELIDLTVAEVTLMVSGR